MTLNGVMAVILRYLSEFAYLPGVLRKSSGSLSHLLMSSSSSYDACLFLVTFHFYRATLCQRCVYYGPASVTHKSGSISKMVQDRDNVLQPTNRKGYVACRIAPFPTTLNELQRHSYIASLFKCDFSYSCASVDSISTDIERRAVPLQ